MITLDNNVADFLDKIYINTAIDGKPQTLYTECENAINSLECFHETIFANEPFAWKRDRATIVKTRRYWFRYQKIGNDYLIQQVYDAYTKQLVTEKKNHIDTIITEVLNRYLGRELLRA